MGLTADIRNFFTERIYAVLDAKLASIMKVVDEKKVTNLALQKFCNRYDLPLDVVEQAKKLEEEHDRIEHAQEVLKRTIGDALTKSEKSEKGYRTSYYNLSGAVDSLFKTSMHIFRNDVLMEEYPEVLPEVQHIEHIRGEAGSVVMLATTPTKLRERLSRLVGKYGGDLKELTDMVEDL